MADPWGGMTPPPMRPLSPAGISALLAGDPERARRLESLLGRNLTGRSPMEESADLGSLARSFTQAAQEDVPGAHPALRSRDPGLLDTMLGHQGPASYTSQERRAREAELPRTQNLQARADEIREAAAGTDLGYAILGADPLERPLQPWDFTDAGDLLAFMDAANHFRRGQLGGGLEDLGYAALGLMLPGGARAVLKNVKNAQGFVMPSMKVDVLRSLPTADVPDDLRFMKTAHVRVVVNEDGSMELMDGPEALEAYLARERGGPLHDLDDEYVDPEDVPVTFVDRAGLRGTRGQFVAPDHPPLLTGLGLRTGAQGLIPASERGTGYAHAPVPLLRGAQGGPERAATAEANDTGRRYVRSLVSGEEGPFGAPVVVRIDGRTTVEDPLRILAAAEEEGLETVPFAVEADFGDGLVILDPEDALPFLDPRGTMPRVTRAEYDVLRDRVIEDAPVLAEITNTLDDTEKAYRAFLANEAARRAGQGVWPSPLYGLTEDEYLRYLSGRSQELRNELILDDLPMDEASRADRAREMGFDPSGTVYHGTGGEWDVMSEEKWSDDSLFGPGFYTTDSRHVAGGDGMSYAGQHPGSQVKPVVVRAERPIDLDDPRGLSVIRESSEEAVRRMEDEIGWAIPDEVATVLDRQDELARMAALDIEDGLSPIEALGRLGIDVPPHEAYSTIDQAEYNVLKSIMNDTDVAGAVESYYGRKFAEVKPVSRQEMVERLRDPALVQRLVGAARRRRARVGADSMPSLPADDNALGTFFRNKINEYLERVVAPGKPITRSQAALGNYQQGYDGYLGYAMENALGLDMTKEDVALIRRIEGDAALRFATDYRRATMAGADDLGDLASVREDAVTSARQAIDNVGHGAATEAMQLIQPYVAARRARLLGRMAELDKGGLVSVLNPTGRAKSVEETQFDNYWAMVKAANPKFGVSSPYHPGGDEKRIANEFMRDVLGVDALRHTGGGRVGDGNPHRVTIALDPTAVRSRYARFDSRRKGSRDTMAGITGLLGAGVAGEAARRALGYQRREGGS